MLPPGAGADSDHIRMQEAAELRASVARALHGRDETIVKEAMGVYPFAGVEHVGAVDRARLAELAFQLISTAVRDGAIDSRHGVVTDLGRLAAEKELTTRVLFTVIYLVERAALDELALDDSFGVESEPWPALTQVIHRAALDVCAALAEQIKGGGDAGVVDPLSTLHTRGVFLAALEKEIQRAERFDYPFAIILLDVDRLADINTRHGYGAGDRVLERVGIVVRGYFRETDWVARVGGDTFAVLLPEIQGADAERLAERIRRTVQERLQLHDHRSDQQYPVTVSVGVLVAESVDRNMKTERLMANVEEALVRAKTAGGNRVERAAAVTADASTPAPARDTPQID